MRIYLKMHALGCCVDTSFKDSTFLWVCDIKRE